MSYKEVAMIVYDLKTMQACQICEPTIVALGTFDGCHIGHMSVFRSAYLMARKHGIKTVAYTFDRIPSSKSENARAIFTLQEKIRHIARAGIDYIAIDDFSKIKDMRAIDFVNQALIGTLKAKGASCGYNYRFGKGAEGDCKALKEIFEKQGGLVEICQGVCINDTPVSSTLIRKMIENGQVDSILDISPPYSIYAKVLEGKRLGRTIGIPTINQIIPKEKISPKRGVYITEVELGEDVYPCVTNVGTRPTVENNGEENMETHIIGYNGSLYNSSVRVNFYKRIRDERRFSSLEALKEQIALDIEEARKYFK